MLTPESYANLKRAFSVDLLHGYGLTEFTPVSGNRGMKPDRGPSARSATR